MKAFINDQCTADAGREKKWRGLLLFGLCLAFLLNAAPRLQAGETNEVERQEAPKRKVFTFEGGNPVEFIAALDRHFRTRLIQILTLPEILSRTRVPKLRVAAEDPREVLSLYNKLESPNLGQWRFEPAAAQKAGGTNMNVLMLEPDRTVTSKAERNAFKVKGVALAGVPSERWELLLHDVTDASRHGEAAANGAGAEFIIGSARLQRESKVLIVIGPDAYIEMVESLVSAHRMNAELEAKAALASKATPPAAVH